MNDQKAKSRELYLRQKSKRRNLVMTKTRKDGRYFLHAIGTDLLVDSCQTLGQLDKILRRFVCKSAMTPQQRAQGLAIRGERPVGRGGKRRCCRDNRNLLPSGKTKGKLTRT